MKTLLAAFAAVSLLLIAPAPFARDHVRAPDEGVTVVSLQLQAPCAAPAATAADLHQQP
jgi:hypothetical protein